MQQFQDRPYLHLHEEAKMPELRDPLIETAPYHQALKQIRCNVYVEEKDVQIVRGREQQTIKQECQMRG
jgi:hypothetical protein